MNDAFVFTPDILLAFTPASNLKELEVEGSNLKKVIVDALCQAPILYPLTIEDLESYGRRGVEPLLIFHYAGHAGENGLEYIEKLAQEENTRVVMPYVTLLGFMKTFPNLKLIFINGCNSERAAVFLDYADAVIYTKTAVYDDVAALFAEKFYHNFLHVNPLDAAFNQIKALPFAVKTIKRDEKSPPSDAESVRDTVSRPNKNIGEGFSVFEIAYRGNPQEQAEIGNTHFNSWRQNSASNLKQTKQEAANVQNLGAQSDAYLLCNRARLHNRIVQNELRDKKDTPHPLFIFIHGAEEDCPSDFRNRFAAYTLPEELGIKTPTEIRLPSPVDSPIERCKLILNDNYCSEGRFGKRNDVDRTWSLVSRKPHNDNEFIVIHHDLIDDEWEETWKDFFDYYLNEFSKELANFSDKLIIVITRTGESDGFTTYFNGLASDEHRKIVNLNQFEKIQQKHITQWQERVFGSIQFNSNTIIPDGEQKFFLDVKLLLQARLKG